MSLTTEHMIDRPTGPKRFDPTGPELRSLRRLDRAIAEFRDQDPPMPLFMVSVLLIVAANPGLTQREIQQRMGVKNATNVSNTILDLSEKGRAGKPGRGMVEQQEHPQDSRAKVIKLTRKGETAIIALLHAMGAASDDT